MIQFNNLQYKSHDNRGIPFENWHNGAAPVQMSEDIPQTCVVLCVCGEEGVQRWWEEVCGGSGRVCGGSGRVCRGRQRESEEGVGGRKVEGVQR